MAYAAELCGSKLRAKLSSTLNEASSEKISSNSFAARHMAKMGWTEGTGLGKKRDGIVSHIKVQKREDNIGLGVEKERTRQMGAAGMWWSSSVADTLSRLQQKTSSNGDATCNGESKKKKKKKTDKKSKKRKKSKKENASSPAPGKVYTEDELFIATGGARFGTKGGKRSEGKWQRSESSKELKEWEHQVKDKVEWNGLGKANVILNNGASRKTSRKRKKSDEESSDDRDRYYEQTKNDNTAEEEEMKKDNEFSKSSKKKQKKDRKSKQGKKNQKDRTRSVL